MGGVTIPYIPVAVHEGFPSFFLLALSSVSCVVLLSELSNTYLGTKVKGDTIAGT